MSKNFLCLFSSLTMPPNAHLVLCSCCNKYITRRREIAHRAALAAPTIDIPTPIESRLHKIDPAVLFDSDEASITTEEDIYVANDFENDEENHIPENDQETTQDDLNVNTVLNNIYQRRHGRVGDEVDSDDSGSVEDNGSDEDEDQDDDNFIVEFPDWDTFDNPSVHAWDQLGEHFEREAAEICMLCHPHSMLSNDCYFSKQTSGI